MKLEGFYNEETLNVMLEQGEVNALEYVYHHSEEKKAEYEEYCRQHGLHQNEESAHTFLEYSLKKEEEAHTEGLD